MADKIISITFVGTAELRDWLTQKAQADDRSVSYVLRQILEAERRRERSQARTNRPATIAG